LYPDVDAKYQEFLNKMDQAGLGTIIAEKQAQVNAFLGK